MIHVYQRLPWYMYRTTIIAREVVRNTALRGLSGLALPALLTARKMKLLKLFMLGCFQQSVESWTTLRTQKTSTLTIKRTPLATVHSPMEIKRHRALSVLSAGLNDKVSVSFGTFLMNSDVLSFLAKTLIICAVPTVIIALIGAALGKDDEEGPKPNKKSFNLKVESLNKRYEAINELFNEAKVLTGKGTSDEVKEKMNALRPVSKINELFPKPATVFHLKFEGDTEPSQVKQLRNEISAVIQNSQPGDFVVLELDSPGGSVTGYGLAAAQLERLKVHGLILTVSTLNLSLL